jgi:hypothetical protein
MGTPTVIRAVRLPNGTRDVGALALFRPGEAKTRAYFTAVPEQASAGAFYDCLIGQQDRNWGNVLWQAERNRICLIDHGFSFGRVGDHRGQQELQEWRWEHGSRQLTGDELAALTSVASSGLGDLDAYVESERVAALNDRAYRMQQDGEVLFWKGEL